MSLVWSLPALGTQRGDPGVAARVDEGRGVGVGLVTAVTPSCTGRVDLGVGCLAVAPGEVDAPVRGSRQLRVRPSPVRPILNHPREDISGTSGPTPLSEPYPKDPTPVGTFPPPLPRLTSVLLVFTISVQESLQTTRPNLFYPPWVSGSIKRPNSVLVLSSLLKRPIPVPVSSSPLQSPQGPNLVLVPSRSSRRPSQSLFSNSSKRPNPVLVFSNPFSFPQ